MKRKIKKFLRTIFVLFLVLGVSVNVQASENDNWTKVGGNNTNSKTIKSNTIKSNADISKRITVPGNFREAIIIDDIIYVVNGDPVDVGDPNGGGLAKATLEAFDLDGKKVMSVALSDSVGFFSRLAYNGSDTIFVSLSSSIQAVDINEEEAKWQSETDSKQMLSQIVYHDGYLYGGAVTAASAAATPSDGYYYAIDANKRISSREKMPYAWTWGKENLKDNGFYWDGAAIVKDSLVFVGDGGKLVSHAFKEDEDKNVVVYDEYNFTEKVATGTHKVRSLVYYNEETDEIIIGTQNSAKIFKIKMDGNKFDRNNIKVVDAVDQISGGLNVSNKNHLYVSSGGMNANHFSIYDAETLEEKFKTNNETDNKTDRYGTQSFPLINDADSKYDYIYFLDYTTGDMIIAKYDGINRPTFERVVLPVSGKSPTYNSGSVIAASEGTLVATKHDGGPLFIIKNKNTYAQSDADVINVDITNVLSKTVTTSDYKKIIDIRSRYNKLSSEEKTKVVGYDKLDEAYKKLDNVISSVKSGNTTYYYKFKIANGKWFNYKKVTSTTKSKVTTTTTSTYNYSSKKMTSSSKKPLNGSIIAKKTTIIKKPGIISGKQYYTYNSKGNLTKYLNYKLNSNYKNILTNKQTKSYYSNGKVKNHYTYKKSLTTNKYTSKSRIYYNSKGKRIKKVNFSYKKGKISNRTEYDYNKNGQLKSNKYGKAYRYSTTYKNGKRVKTTRRQYSSSGKLNKKSVKVKLRTSF